MVGTSSGLGGFMSGASIRFSKLKNGTGGADAWRDSLQQAAQSRLNSSRPRTSGTAMPKLHSIHKATVVSMQAFGCFVQLGDGNTYKDGLLHVSCLGETRFEHPEEAGVKQGMALWVKVSEVKEDDMKYGVDMRYVSQRDGSDLDPYQTKGRLPNNFFEGGKVKQPAAAAPDDRRASPAAGRLPGGDGSRKRKGASEDDDGDSGSDDSSVSSGAKAKMKKELEKAKKKLEKLRKAAEKVKKKARKGKEKKGGKDSGGSSDFSA